MDSPLLCESEERKDPAADERFASDAFSSTSIATTPTKETNRARPYHKRLIAVSVALHVGLVLLHIVLFIVYSHHLEHRLIVPWSSWLPAAVTALSQSVGIAYLAILMLVTQRLSLFRDLYESQTLTAFHDKNNAWLGLVSAISTTFQQFSIRAAPASVFCITLYHVGIFALHITILTLFHILPVNGTMEVRQKTQLANASYDFTSPHAYDILTVYDQLPSKLGLQDNMVYDVIPTVPSATGTTKVNASMYVVDCFATANAPGPSTLNSSTDDDGSWTFQLDDYATVGMSPPHWSAVSTTNVVDPGRHCNHSSNEECWTPIVVASTVPVVDASGNQPSKPWVPIIPSVLYPSSQPAADNSQETATFGYVPSIQILACAVDLKYTLIDVSAVMQVPMPDQFTTGPSTWKNWKWDWPDNTTVSDKRLLAAQQTPSNAASDQNLQDNTMFVPRNVTPYSTIPTVLRPDATMHKIYKDWEKEGARSILYSQFDSFLNYRLGLLDKNKSAISLEDLNHGIGSTLAAVYWYGKNLNFSDPRNRPEDLEGLSNATLIVGSGEAVISVTTLRGQLNLSLTPLLIGAVCSVALLLLSVYFICLPSKPSAVFDAGYELDSAGILQLTWLLGNEPRLSGVSKPDVKELRKAGMFNVEMRKAIDTMSYSRSRSEEDC